MIRARTIFLLFGGGLLLGIACLVALFLFISSSTPLPVEKHTLHATSVLQAKQVLKQLRDGVLTPGQQRRLVISQDDLNSMLAMAQRGISRLSGQADISEDSLTVTVVLHVPENPFGDYINVQAVIPPSSNGATLNSFTVGHISLPGGIALWLGEWLTNLILGDRLGSVILQSVDRVELSTRQATVYYQPIPDLPQRLSQFKTRAKAMRDEWVAVADPREVQFYYHELCRYGEMTSFLPAVSLADYLGIAFTLAQRRSAGQAEQVAQNKASIMALAIYLGSKRFQLFVGDIANDESISCSAPRNVVLAGREDLRLHFIYSAALKVLSDSGISSAIGEFKELLDANRGGSGFSFVDLAADRAGVRFAELALDPDAGARQVQEMLARRVEESMFFPDITGLQENLSQASFEQHYHDLESAEYRAVVQLIDQRIAQLALHQRPHVE